MVGSVASEPQCGILLLFALARLRRNSAHRKGLVPREKHSRIASLLQVRTISDGEVRYSIPPALTLVRG